MTQLEQEVTNKYYGSTHCKRKHANRTLTCTLKVGQKI